VPARYAVFDIWDVSNQKFLSYNDQRLIVSNLYDYNCFIVHELFSGTGCTPDIVNFLEMKSKYAVDGVAEGIVIKAFTPDRQDISGKIVRREFTEGIEVHHLRTIREKNMIDAKLRKDI
jgi:hypothetical protein